MRVCVTALVVIVVAQWALQTADAIGGGMFSFDVLWYHMPFAAAFAQTGSVTHIQFTQADPFVAYYPATSELVHALGIEALGNDFLSPILNLGWMTLALLAGWAIGRRWNVQPLTLAVCALALALPVLSMTQPGEAFDDIVGLATLLSAVALLASEDVDGPRLFAVGVALGLAIGTKYTFVLPAIVLVLGVPWITPRRRLARTVLVAAPAIVTGGWWYLRALIHTGNPLGIRSTIGPITLPGPRSPLADAAQQTVLSQISHVSLWGTRFVPGLSHALGVLWPVILVAWILVLVLTLWLLDDRVLRLIAITAALAGITYLVFPTGASAIAQSSQLFAINLRYVMPALTLGLLLVPILISLRAPRRTLWVAPSALLIAVTAQLEPNLWPTQTARHIVFGVITLAVLAGAVTLAIRRHELPRLTPVTLTAGVAASAVLLVAAGFLIQRHYFHLRYRVADSSSPGMGAIYAWAQSVSGSRIALYGTVEQYPLYGTEDNNRLTYLGRNTDNGGYQPISSCAGWQRALRVGDYQYLVLTPGPTGSPPMTWTTRDARLKPILHPAAGEWVFQIQPGGHASDCA